MANLCRQTPELLWLADVIVALAHTGMRIGELATLTWACVDLKRNMIVLKDESRSRVGKGREARTNKGRRTRCIPIHEALRSVLDALHSDGNTGHVFAAMMGGRLHPGNLRATLIEQVIRPLEQQFPTPDGEVGFRDGRLHSFRHYFCSWSANSGVSEQAVLNWLGQRHSDMVRHYYQLHDEQAQLQLKKLGRISGLDAT